MFEGLILEFTCCVRLYRRKDILHLLDFENRVNFACKEIYVSIMILNKSPRNKISINYEKHISGILPNSGKKISIRIYMHE
jgi:hypothetical protein